MGERRENPELDAAKRDLSYLLSVLSISSTKTSEMHAVCPGCGRKCLQFGPDKSRAGEWYWHCNSGCGSDKYGDVVSALMMTRGMDYKAAFAQIRTDFAGRVGRPSQPFQRPSTIERGNANSHGYTSGVVGALYGMGNPGVVAEPRKPDPVIDKERAEAYIAKQHEYLMENFGIVEKYKRGLSRAVCEKYRIGFTEFGKVQFAPWQKPMEIPAAWILPITNEFGELKGVKAHFEERPHWGGRQCPKTLWLPFGTFPAYSKVKDSEGREIETKPVHMYDTMWPHPATLTPQVVSDFSLEASFYIERIPPHLKPEWNDIYEAQKYKVADEQSTVVEELEGPSLHTAMLRAFAEMKTKITDAVIAIEDEKDKKNSQITEEWADYDFITTGELKALACESSGLMASAGTAGEGRIPRADLLLLFAGRKVCLLADDDPPRRLMDPKEPEVVKKVTCTGRDWVLKMAGALSTHGTTHIVAKYGGQKG